MAELFKTRRSTFRNRCLKYSRYVFNDHFVLVLMFLLGFLLVQYSQLLRHFPKQPWPIALALFLLCLVLPFWGNVATYVDAADKYYLLVRETEVTAHIKSAVRRAYLFWTAVQSLLLVLVAPLFLALSLPLWGFVLILLFLAVAKYIIFQARVQPFFNNSHLNWETVITAEQKRQQAILKFFSLFTTVKGISSSVKRRKYLDGLLFLAAKRQDKAWLNLYVRAFLRSGDYFALTLRLFILAVLSILLIDEGWLAFALVLVFNYLLLFQLLALFNHFDYHRMSQFLPPSQVQKVTNFRQFLTVLMLILTVIEALLFFQWQISGSLILAMSALFVLYIPYKLKKMID
ncbi:ABC transporter permease [Streptococcus dentiloxodontae]